MSKLKKTAAESCLSSPPPATRWWSSAGIPSRSADLPSLSWCPASLPSSPASAGSTTSSSTRRTSTSRRWARTPPFSPPCHLPQTPPLSPAPPRPCPPSPRSSAAWSVNVAPEPGREDVGPIINWEMGSESRELLSITCQTLDAAFRGQQGFFGAQNDQDLFGNLNVTQSKPVQLLPQALNEHSHRLSQDRGTLCQRVPLTKAVLAKKHISVSTTQTTPVLHCFASTKQSSSPSSPLHSVMWIRRKLTCICVV